MSEIQFDFIHERVTDALYLKIHTEPSSYILNVDENDLAQLRETLDEPPEEL
jgi:hypothetical protein